MSALDDFQAALLTAIDEGGTPDAVMARAQHAAPDALTAEWIASWDPRLVALATELVHTWALRDDD
jgi:hypothetical protein